MEKTMAPGHARPRARAGALAVAAAALMLSGCVVPYQDARESSMLASNARCGAALDSRFDRPVDPARPDPELVGEALRHVVNRERCARALTPLGASAPAARAAQGHARAMAEHGFTDHASPVAGRETFSRRLNAESARFGIAGENVATTALYAVGSAPYEVVDAARCRFRRPAGGPPIPQQSYRMLAERLVKLWMRSPEHRENMLRPRYRQMGAGAAVGAVPGSCGRVSAAAVFLG